ncbi:MAG TPA: elongation factor G [Candidatus Krumholzibacteria bacterium]|nr:elongation factor G [Candidatus Krumholzibacteria bacterium]HPD71051.1 elongation factor G [Candidatus Krumholzibacteria bacterium]HRY39249.1 elongation factor G [Candidatus Krumholzibacteria bacterium]
MATDLSRVRNIGISAHIDSGKTTLSERILFYTGRIRTIHEVKGKDGVGATMDSMDLERERGITIQSAATHCEWDGHSINLIDTPGHVDFTIEVERALRVLDGAVLVLCAVAGVQSQSITVDRQMRRYRVPRLAFVNKCDRSGANPMRVTDQLREKLGHNAVMLQLPLGLEAEHEGVIDLVRMQVARFEGPHGETVAWSEIPDPLRVEAEARRELLLDAASMYSDELTEAILEGAVTEALVHDAIRRGTLANELTPVLLGSAYKNKGVQLLLDAVVRYLPNPTEVRNEALEILRGGEERGFVLSNDPADELIAHAFKLEDGLYGQLTYIRLYQGDVRKGSEIVNTRTGRKVKVGRLGRMHADQMEDIETAQAGDIVALFGIDCASGDTFTGGRQVSLTSMHVPEPVISLAIAPADAKSQAKLAKALHRFTREDPTFRTAVDPETGDTLIRGMGELHLEVYVERMRREFNALVTTGQPKVAYRETMTRAVAFSYTHRKQTGGSGQYARVMGRIEPSDDGQYHFVNAVVGGSIPTEYIGACEKGFHDCIHEGALIGAPVQGLKVVLEDGDSHAVDSSDMAFQTACRMAFRESYLEGAPIALEPLMLVSVEGPSEQQGEVLKTLMQRRGIIMGTTEATGFVRIDAHVPLGDMFGYASVLRSATAGKAEFTMEFARYAPAPKDVAEQLRKEYLEKRAKGK